MSYQIGIGFNQDTHIEMAARKAAVESRRGLMGTRPVITIVFSTVQYPPEITLPIIRQSFMESKIIGCSTAGIILPHSISTRGIGVLSIHHPEMTVGISQLSSIDSYQDLSKAGSILAQQTLQNFNSPQRDFFLCFTPGMIENLSLFLTGLRTIFGNIFPMVGAGSCDDFHFNKTFQIYEDEVLNNSAIGLLFGCPNLAVGIGSAHGWRPIGKPRYITKAIGNVIYTIDKKPAAALYEEFFDQKMGDLRNDPIGKMMILYPLGLLSEETGEYLLRNPVDILYDGSIVCQGEVSPGAEVHIMIGNKESCKSAFEIAANQAISGLLGKAPRLVLIIESMSRLKLFGHSAHQEHEGLHKIFGTDIPIIGFYSNGEFCPSGTSDGMKRTHLQNGSVVICAIG
ncbi:MAG: FIST C-terminal domain-containing protein [Candidatus Omnitrophica bacterium]|nr:FIST C-terminal domain-containing protein [Candidatus Omnitrophota bacterium]